MSNKIYREEHGTWTLMLGCKGLTLSLPQVTKTEFFLTMSIQYQAGR